MGDATVQLRDGRVLGYGEGGDPHGLPVLVFHGGAGSRIIPDLWDRQAKQIGVRMIRPERPGFGLSTFQPDRRIVDWPADVVQLVDALDLPQFAVTGVSGGCPYVLACARALPDRIVATGIVAGIGPLDREGALEGMPEPNRASFVGLVETGPSAVKRQVEMTLEQARDRRDEFVETLAASMPDVPGKEYDKKEMAEFLQRDVVEGLGRGTDGYCHEAWLYTQPWGFAPDEVTMHVELWYGDKDVNVPLHHGRYLEATLPNARLTVLHGQDHSMCQNNFDEVFAALVAAASDD